MSPPEVLLAPELLDRVDAAEWPEASGRPRRRRANTPQTHAEDDLALACLYRSMPAEVLRVAAEVLSHGRAEVLQLHLEDTPTPEIVARAGVKNRGTVYTALHGRDGEPGAIATVLAALRADPNVLKKVERLVTKKSKPSPAAVLCSHLAAAKGQRYRSHWDTWIEQSALHQLSLLADAKGRMSMIDTPIPKQVIAEVVPMLRDQGWVEIDGNHVVIVKRPPIEEEATDG